MTAVTIDIVNLSAEHSGSLRDLLLAEGWTDRAQRLSGRLASQSLGFVRNPEVYVALASATVVGFMEGTFESSTDISDDYPPPRACVESLLVSSRARRQGVGAALLHRFAADAKEAGRSSVVLFPDPREPEGRLAFFKRCGLVKVDNSELYGASLESVLTSTHPG